MEKNLEAQDECSFTTQIMRKGTLDNDIPNPLVSLSLLQFPASFSMFKWAPLMRPTDWIWISLKEKLKKRTKLYNSCFTISVSKIIIKKKKLDYILG